MTLKKRVIIAVTAGIAALLGATVVTYMLATQTQPVLPKQITSKIAFIYYTPQEMVVLGSSVAFEEDVLSFRARDDASDEEVSLVQQATPEVFIDVPQYYPTLLDRLNRYKAFESKHGTVYLTNPKELNGDQQAIMNTKGTLLFVHPERPWDETRWRQFFNTLEVYK